MRLFTLTSLSLMLGVSACSSYDTSGTGSTVAEENVASAPEAATSKSGFGFGSVDNSTASVDAATADADARTLISVGSGLRVRVVSADPMLGANTDQMALWPNDKHPTHLIVVNEQGTTEAGVQRISLSDGSVETILSGLTSGDPLRRTPWGTILAGEEGGTTGQMVEIIDPLGMTGVTYDRVTGIATGGVGAANVAPRWALGRLSFEGLAMLPNGVVYYGDELRPGNGVPGGGMYKFIPTNPYPLDGAPITSLSQSPLASGQVYGLKLSRGSNNGQGNNTGLGVWVMIPNSDNANLRAAGTGLGLSGFYRPEDADLDKRALNAGTVRFCVNNTGNETDNNYGETICINDGPLSESTTNVANPDLQFFILGNPQFAMMDNIAYNGERNFWALNEDGEGPTVGHNNDIWACSQDGSDFDLLADSCARFASLNDLNAESTGGLFDGSGRKYYVSIQHNVTGHGVVLEISGF